MNAGARKIHHVNQSGSKEKDNSFSSAQDIINVISQQLFEVQVKHVNRETLYAI